MHLCFIWTANIIFWSLYVGLTQYYFGKNRDLKGCTVYFLNYAGFALFNATVSLILPTMINIILYISIYKMTTERMKVRKSLKETNKKMTVMTVSDSKTGGKNDKENMKDGNNKKYQNRKIEDSVDKKAIRTIALLLITFAVCWMPLAFVFIMEAVKPG